MQQLGMRIAAVGDLQLGDSPSCVGFGFRSRYGPDKFADVLAGVRSALQEADVVFGNLETPLSDRDLATGSWASYQLRGRPAYARSLRAAGFTVLSLANNHSAQHGVDAFHDTRRALTEAGIASCGVRGTGPWASQPVVLPTAAGFTVGVLGYSLRPRQYGSDEPPYAEGDPVSMRADVARLRPAVDAVIVSLHWGEEFVDTPSATEVGLGRTLLDAGAALIIGHHPHVVRPVECYGQGLIAHSLGNFAGDMVWYPPFRCGALLRCVLSRDGVTNVQVLATRVREDFRVEIEGPGAEPLVGLEGLPEPDYRSAIGRTQREQRFASYRYALRHLHRYSPGMLTQLAARTLRNKLFDLVAGPR
jgi:poly-gamma-glutamate synthesis protein (capsule biosynthesis protein)